MKKDTVITQIEETADAFTKYIKKLYEQDRFDERFNNKWKIRDVLAHILWYEEEIAKMIKLQSIKSSSPIWDNDFDDRNKLVDEEMEGIDNEKLFKRHDDAVEKIVSAVSGLTDAHMSDPSLFEGMPEEWLPWQIIGGSTFFHYTDHLRRLKEFNEGEGGSS